MHTLLLAKCNVSHTLTILHVAQQILKFLTYDDNGIKQNGFLTIHSLLDNFSYMI